MNKIYVVEGKRDEEILRLIDPNLIIFTTNGFSLSNNVVENLKQLEDNHEIVLLLDPDYPGEKIRRILTENLKSPRQIYIPKEWAISEKKNKVGLEHVDLEKIREILENEIILKPQRGEFTTITMHELGLTGQENSLHLRNLVSNHFHLPKCNAKKMIRLLNGLGITIKELKEVLNESQEKVWTKLYNR